jgi:uncharacterized protein (DUF58 family)
MRAELERACLRYRLGSPARPLAGRSGDRIGRGTGASLEFMDFRDYVPGDDLRHVDWRSYARTEQYKVRLFREEVSPAAEIVADVSASMAVTPGKERALRDLVEAFALWIARGGGQPRRLAAGGGRFEDAERVPIGGGTAAASLLPQEPLRPRSVRVLISDFLVAQDCGPDIRRLMSGAAELGVVQLLDPWELEPRLDGPTALLDCEDGARLDVDTAPRTLSGYRERLARLCSGVELAARGAGAAYVRVPAAAPERMFADHLLPHGIVEPAA